MEKRLDRRQFVKSGAVVAASAALPSHIFAGTKKSVLVFTKSSGWEHDVVKRVGGKLSIVEQAITSLGNKQGFNVTCTKDGRVFDSKDFHKYAAVAFFTTGDLTTVGTDKNPPMSAQGKQSFLNAIHNGIGFVGIHAASDTFHTQPDPQDNSNRYIAHGDKSDPYLRMLGGEFITHGSNPRLQDAKITVNDPKFPGLEGVTSPFTFNDEWYSLKDFRTDLHVILTIDTKGMIGKPYERPPYPMTWARMEGKGRVFYSTLGHTQEAWQDPDIRKMYFEAVKWAMGLTDGSTESHAKPAANPAP